MKNTVSPVRSMDGALLSQKKKFYSQSEPKATPNPAWPAHFHLDAHLLSCRLRVWNKHPASANSQEHFLATGFPGMWCPLLLASSSWPPAPRHASCSSHTALSRIQHLPVHAIFSTLSWLKPMNFVRTCVPRPHSTVTSRLYSHLKLQINL